LNGEKARSTLGLRVDDELRSVSAHEESFQQPANDTDSGFRCDINPHLFRTFNMLGAYLTGLATGMGGELVMRGPYSWADSNGLRRIGLSPSGRVTHDGRTGRARWTGRNRPRGNGDSKTRRIEGNGGIQSSGSLRRRERQFRFDGDLETVKTTILQVLGESAGQATLFYLQDGQNITDSAALEARLRTIFGDGADLILQRLGSEQSRRSSESAYSA
jgi:hypothetical protein